ncbi:MAG: protease 2 [Bacteroides sp. SM23_62_1]|nr:MAG: protease 2 [Bacteroides sp. SM23_62_1]
MDTQLIRVGRYILVILLADLVISCSNRQTSVDMTPPIADKKPKELTIHNDTRIDDYFWLKDRDNPEVIDYLKAENEYTDAIMKDTEKLQEKLYNEIIGRIKQTDESVPYRNRGYYYYTRFEEGKEYPIFCRKKGSMDAEEEVLLNVNEMAEDYDYFQVAGFTISPDNMKIAYGVDTISRRKYTVYFKDLATGEIYPDAIPLTTGGAFWANDNKTVFYTQKDDETLRPQKIFRHVLGTPVESDVLIFHEEDETYSTYVYKTKSEQYMMIVSSSTLSDEYKFLNADDPMGEFTVMQPRERNLEYSVDHYKDKFYIVTNLEAKNFRLMETPVSNPGKENWKEVIAHRDDVYLDDIEIFAEFLVVEERKDGLNQLRIIRWDDGTEHYLDFGEEDYVASASTNPEFESKWLRYNYSSLTTPSSVYDYNMETQEKKLLKQQEVVGDFDPSNYEAKRLYAPAGDGVKIPISLVYRKGTSLDGSNPLLLYGYGSYGHTIDPYFNSVRLSLLDRGFVYAIAHIRGSQIYGRQWYEDGKLYKKMNTFTDFNACAEYLIELKYTNKDKLFAQGGSAGGLLMGAIVNLRPDLYKGIIANVPFVDVVTTMLDEDIPLTTSEYDEWGNPNEKGYYEYMLSYSPYDNVEAKDYPAMLVTTGLHDSQVQYWEPAKWVAKLRDMKTDNNILLLHTNMEAGHGGASGRFERYRETAMEYAFMFKLLGIKK